MNPTNAHSIGEPADLVNHSWSKASRVRDLVARKQVDNSIFHYGAKIPRRLWSYFEANAGQGIPPGQSRQVTLEFEGQEYQARLVAADPNNGELPQLRYDDDPEFLEVLRKRFSFSYEYLHGSAGPFDTGAPVNQVANIAEDQREFMEIYRTGQPFRFRIRAIQARCLYTGWAEEAPASFEQVWETITSAIGVGLATGNSGVQSVGDEGVSLASGVNSIIVPRSEIEASWQALRAAGALQVSALPTPSTSTVATILSLLPYVDFTPSPQPTLFLTKHTFDNAQLSATFGVTRYTGIRYGGKASAPRLVVFTTGDPSIHHDHPYVDWWEQDTLYYCNAVLKT